MTDRSGRCRAIGTQTVDTDGRPRSRVLHPYWEWDGTS